MKMNIKVVQKIENLKAPVFLLGAGANIADHEFFKSIEKADKDYVRLFTKKSREEGEFSQSVFLPSGSHALFVGIKNKKLFTFRNSVIAMRRVIALAKKEKIKEISVNFDDFIPEKRGDEEALAELMAAQFELANFEFTRYKTPPKDGWNFVENVFVFSKEHSKKIQIALERGNIIGQEINKARALSNTPGSDMTPARLAEAAAKAGKTCGFEVRILKEDQIRKLNMGGVLGVSRGSTERPRFIIIEYWGDKKSRRPKGVGTPTKASGPIVLIGKGVTFDTGGLNLKPEQAIYEMHMDMSGGAAVIHTIAALARLKIKKNVIGLIPAVENMPSGSSYHPGDVLKTMSGKTIEVLNTDAEGRIILADALEYSKKYKPRLVIDIATLTGSAMSALGQRASAIFTTDSKLEKALRETGEKTGDYVWPLPLWEEFEEEIKGTFGDVANLGKTRYGGAITGAVFLWQFIKNQESRVKSQIPWVHIDIAPRMTAIEGEFLSKGAAGASIGLLTKFLREF